MGASSAIELAGWPMAGCSVRSGAAQPNGRKRVKAISDRRVFIIKPINCFVECCNENRVRAVRKPQPPAVWPE